MSRCAWLALVLATGSAVADTSVPPGYRHVADTHGVPPVMLYAIALAESGRHVAQQGVTRPWPWTLNVHGKGRYYPSRTAATEALHEAIASGRDSVDIGLMQVNWRYHGAAFASPEAALDPYRNLSVAAAILMRCYRQRRDWWAAVGCYHAPNSPSRADRYWTRVKTHWQALQASPTAG